MERRISIRHTPALLLIPLLTGCAAIETIFKAGVWVGIIAVVAVIAALFGLIKLLTRGG